MNYRNLGRSDVRVSEVSFGCWTMGGLNWVNGQPNGWANVDEADIEAAIKAGLDAGVNHFDNADVYGNGKAERMLSRILKRLGVKSESVVIASKVGHFPGTFEHPFHPRNVRHQCEASLINLERDYIDLYYFHHGSFGPYLHEATAELDKLVREGKVRLKGQSAYSADDFEQAVPVVRPVVLQSWAHALDDQFIREGSRVRRLMDEHDLMFVAFSPLAQARLLDKYDPSKPPTFEPGDHRKDRQDFSADAIAALKPKLARLKERFGPTTEDLAATALNYLLANPRVCCVIPGFRNERQARCNLAGIGRKFTPEDVAFVRKVLA